MDRLCTWGPCPPTTGCQSIHGIVGNHSLASIGVPNTELPVCVKGSEKPERMFQGLLEAVDDEESGQLAPKVDGHMLPELEMVMKVRV